MSTVLQTEQLGIGYTAKGKKKILHKGITLQLEEGQLVCLLGPNGAGKSTLLRTLSGVQSPLEGEIRIPGAGKLEALHTRERARYISLVLTEKAVAGNLRVEELLALGRYPFTNWAGQLLPEDHQHIEDVLLDLKLDPLRKEALYTLSDGQQQKAMIARALVQNGQIIILDEPTAHLDIPNKMGIMRMLRDIAKSRNKAILVATHELDLALEVADEFWLMGEQGQFYRGVPEELLLKGRFNEVFNQKELHFDPGTGRFRFSHPKKMGINLKAPEPVSRWLLHALEKEGYTYDASSSLKIEMEANLSWNFQTDTKSFQGQGMKELLRTLAQIHG